MKHLIKYSIFESNEESNLLDTLEFVGPREYFDLIEVAALDNGKVIGYSHYKGFDSESWHSDLLYVHKDYRNNNYPLLALILRLLTHAVTERLSVTSEDYSASGEGFMRKYEALGYWEFDIDNKKATLTDKGIEATEEYAKKYLNIININWNWDSNIVY